MVKLKPSPHARGTEQEADALIKLLRAQNTKPPITDPGYTVVVEAVATGEDYDPDEEDDE